jgi:hypothetical protein
MGGGGVPFIIVGNKKISGYSPSAIIASLDGLRSGGKKRGM